MISSNEKLAFHRIPAGMMEVIRRRWYDFVDGGTDFDFQAVNRDPNLASGNNSFVVSASGEQVRLNSGTTQIRLVGVEALEINGQAGNDRLTVNSTVGTALTSISFNGGDGNDT